MNFILFTPKTDLQYEISHRLIPNGVNIINGKALDEIYDADNPFHYCLIDHTAFLSTEILRMVYRKRKENLNPRTRFILLAAVSDQNNISSSTLMGFDFIIPLNLNLKKIAELIQIFILKNSPQNDQRKYIRFQVQDNENAFVHLFGFTKITDISMNGIAVNMNPDTLKTVNENTIFDQTQIVLENKSIFSDLKLLKTDLKLIRKDQGKAIFQFENLDEKSKDFLAEYIYYKTQETFRPHI